MISQTSFNRERWRDTSCGIVRHRQRGNPLGRAGQTKKNRAYFAYRRAEKNCLSFHCPILGGSRVLVFFRRRVFVVVVGNRDISGFL